MKQILVVEDDSAIRETIRILLESEGYRVLAAKNGQDALEFLKKNETPCLILLDLNMPVMDGWQFLQARKTDESIAAIPVVIISAVANHFHEEEVVGTVRKPFELETLLKVVKQYCGSRHAS
jgi:CheY-like chemotaxis protein